MPNDQSANGIAAPSCSKSATAGDDEGLLALEAQLDDLVVQLLAAQEANGELIANSDQLRAVPDSASGGGPENAPDSDTQAENVDAILARLYPIERAIMTARALSIVGLAVKARHAAYVISQYWEEPTAKIDWEGTGNPAADRGGLRRHPYAIVISDTREVILSD